MNVPTIPKIEIIKTAKKATKKANKVVTLPELQTYLIQPNRITNAIFEGFTLLQHKAVTAIMLNLQEAIKLNMANSNFEQLSLFQSFDKSIQFSLSLKDITNDPTAYNDVKEAILKMTSIGVKIPLKDENGHNFYFASSLITALIPEVANYKSNITIKIENTIAKYLIEIDKGKNGVAQQFTRFVYEVTQNATSIYTIPLYKLISSWKKKGGFTISYKELRILLAIPDNKYKVFKDFKRDVLMPAHSDLFNKADCWFNAEDGGLKSQLRNKEGVKELFLNFKVITQESKDMLLEKRKNCIELLKRHFEFKQKDLNNISHILENESISTDLINRKIIRIAEGMEANKNIKSKSAYAVKSILEHKWLID